MQARIRTASEQRGFAVTRLLTHWAEVVGEQTAAIALPVTITYGRDGMGATLVLLTTGAQAPMLDMQREQIREKVNACYGYRAIARVKITQTAPTGFAEGRAAFTPAPKASRVISDDTRREATDLSREVEDTGLRDALAALGANVLSRRKAQD